MKPKSDKRERLLHAAAEVFWQHGFSATSLADIAHASDIPLGNIYYYFKTKAAIAEGFAEIFVASTLRSLAGIDQNAKLPAEKLTAFVALLKESAATRAERGCPIANAIRDFSPLVPAAASRTNDVFDTLIGWVGQTLSRAGDRNALRHARSAIARWQGAIVLAQAARDPALLLEALSDLEADLLIWSKSG